MNAAAAMVLDRAAPETTLDDLERRLINAYQRGMPVSKTPYADVAAGLGVSETDVLAALERLRDKGVLSRVGAVMAPHRAGWSTLAAMAVPPERLDAVAALINSYPEVNHNYERGNAMNLWFVVAGPDEAHVRAVLADMAAASGIAVVDLPLAEAYHIDLGFPLP
jgi:siroheme decarboxylase